MKKYVVMLIFSLFLFLDVAFAYYKAPVDITTMSIEELLDAMEKGYLNSETLVHLYLDRIDAYDDLFNSINQINDNAIEEAKILDKEREEGKLRGRLHGIPILVKSNIDVLGIPTTAGTKSLSDNYPLKNSEVVQRLVDEGAIILGSTNMSELAFSAANSYSSYGYVKNVFNVDYTSYGSSGGSAVSVAAVFAAASLGTDTNSSVRLPASGAGLVGIRPTLGLVSRSGVIPYDIERDTVGVLSRNVMDNALLLEIISGEDSKDSYTSGFDKLDVNLNKDNLDGVVIGVPIQYTKGEADKSGVFGKTDDEIYDLVKNSIDVLEESGATIVYLADFVKESNISIATSTYAGITMCDNFNDYIKGTTGTIRSFEQLAESSGHVQKLSGYVDGCNGEYISKKVRDEKKAIYRNYVDEIFDTYDLDVIIYPTLKNKVYKYNKYGNISPGSSLGSVIGYPSITIPMGKAVDGFYYGLEFMGLANSENDLYNITSVFEKNNGNKLVNSDLTPSLYTVPNEVTDLIELYEEVLSYDDKNGQVKEWLNLCSIFFDNYNNYDDIVKEANNLIEECANCNIKYIKEDYVKYPNLLHVVIYIIVFLALLLIIKNVSRKV